MAKRSITTQEIALIKAMLNRGMKNKDIQFFFNRPARPVNSGRITDILNGSYSDSNSIHAASVAELVEFLAKYEASPTGVNIEASFQIEMPQSTGHSSYVKSLFHEVHGLGCQLRDGETDSHECKHEFDPKKLTQIIRAIAALSNNKGGYVLIGVKDDMTCDSVSQSFLDTDVAHIMDKVKHFLSPTPSVTTKSTVLIGGKTIGYIHVDPHPQRPVIVYRDGDKLAEGDILFRYAGQSCRIKFGDLRAMLDERDRLARIAFANVAGKLAEIAPASAMVIDTEKNVLDANGRTIVIDEKLAQTLKFIKEGDFDQKEGAPTLKLMGEVSISKNEAVIQEKIAKEAIFQEDILQRFFDQIDIDDPFQYIVAGISQPRSWQPLFFFARQAEMANADVITKLKENKNLPKAKLRSVVERMSGKKKAFSKPASKTAKKYLAEIIAGTVVSPTTAADAAAIAQAVVALPEGSYELAGLTKVLGDCKAMIEDSDKTAMISWIYKAACRLDEIIYFAEG